MNGRKGATLLLVDGSGHGPHAAHAAETAARAFADNIDKECVPLVEAIHRALVPTRGAALAVARIDGDARVIRFVGVGNIGAVLANGGEARRMASYNGTAGHVVPRIREFTYPFTGRPLVILHSDGLSARWEMAGSIWAEPLALALALRFFCLSNWLRSASGIQWHQQRLAAACGLAGWFWITRFFGHGNRSATASRRCQKDG